LIDYHCTASGKSIQAFAPVRLLTLRQSMDFLPRTGKTIIRKALANINR